jgi:hypothetical protein
MGMWGVLGLTVILLAGLKNIPSTYEAITSGAGRCKSSVRHHSMLQFYLFLHL